MAIGVLVSLTPITCHKCGATYGLTERYVDERRMDGKGWHCPYCEQGTAFCENECDRLRKEIARERQKLDQAKAEIEEKRRTIEKQQRQKNSLRGCITRTRNKFAKGECPCCGEVFTNLKTHMTAKHPEFVEKHSETKPTSAT